VSFILYDPVARNAVYPVAFFVTGFVTGAATRRIAGVIELNDFLQTPLGGALVAVVMGVLLLGSAPFWWPPLKAWWWRRAVKGLPDYVRVRSERYVGASRILDIDDRVRMRNDLCRDMGAFVNRAGVSRRTLAHSGNEGLVVALAGAIAGAPRKGDDLLIIMTDNSQLCGHAQHKIIDALDVLSSQPGLISPVDHNRIKAWVDGIADEEPKLPARIIALKGKLE
jgi:hypothetical protein